jgi:hypothetical protein
MAAIENALANCIDVLEKSYSRTGSWVVTESQINMAFEINNQQQVEFNQGTRESQDSVIHNITFTIEAKTQGLV